MYLEALQVLLQILNLALLVLKLLLTRFVLLLGQEQGVPAGLHLLEYVKVVSNGLDPLKEASCIFEGLVSVLIGVVCLSKNVLYLGHDLWSQPVLVVGDKDLGQLGVSKHIRPNCRLPVARFIDTLRAALDYGLNF